MSSPATSASGDHQPAKRRQILSGARQVFSELGFERASVDLIASRAGVSKATVYNHFVDKKALFLACVTQDAEEMRAGLRCCLDEPAGDVVEALERVGEELMRVYLSPVAVGLYRNAIAEAVRFGDVGQTIFERGPRVLQESIASYLQAWERKGALRLGDAPTAALHFVALCQGDLLTRSRLGILAYPVDEAIRDAVRRGVEAFVRAYGA